MEKKFLRMLVVVDAPVLDEDRNNGGNGRSGNGGGGNSGNGNGLYPLSTHWGCYQKDLPSSYNKWLPAGEAEFSRRN